jgi:hypothetical protein
MSSKLNGMPDVLLSKVQEQATDDTTIVNTTSDDEGKDAESAKSLDMIREYQRNLDLKLKRLNV